MRKFRFEGNNKGLHWDKKPISGCTYSIDQIKNLYGKDSFHANEIEDIIETWMIDPDYEEDIHGKWIEVTDELLKQLENGK